MDVEFTVDPVKNEDHRRPRLEEDGYIMVLGSQRLLLQAFQHATTELLRWLVSDYGFDERTAAMVMVWAASTTFAGRVASLQDCDFYFSTRLKTLPGRRRLTGDRTGADKRYDSPPP